MRIGEKVIKRPIRWGMVGGGKRSNVGYKHRSAALRDNISFQLLAGSFGRDLAQEKVFAENIGVQNDRCYENYQIMFQAEAKREDGIEAVTIATPNNTHYDICKAALLANLHVICEKPLFFTIEEGREIKELAEKKNKIVGVTYGFSGYPILLQMREMVRRGDLGKIRMIDLQYTYGIASSETIDQTNEGQKWRVTPEIAGPSFVLGDISTHVYYMSRLICPHEKIKEVLCDRQSFIQSRFPLEDNAYCLMHYDSGAVGRVWASAVDAGCTDGRRIRIIGEKASIEFNDQKVNEIIYEVQGEPSRKLIRGMPYLYDLALEDERLGVLHPEGLIESWSNLYERFALAIDAKERQDLETLEKLIYPDIEAGLEGIHWICKCVESANKGSVWVPF